MASTQTKHTDYPLTATYEQLKEAGENVLAAARKAGALYVDSYEQAVDRALGIEAEFANGTRQEWLRGLIDAHVDFSRELTRSYTSAARSVLR